MLWLVLVPIITVPSTLILTSLILHTNACHVTPDFFGGQASCQVGLVLVALLPGLLNLAPTLWLRSTSSKTRFAAIAATSIGAIRLVVPAAILIANASADPANANYGSCGGRCAHLWWGFQPAFPNSGTVGASEQFLGTGIDPSYEAVWISLFLWFVTILALIAMRWVPSLNVGEP